MFVSAGLDLKFHNWPLENDDLHYIPEKPSNINTISWSKGNDFLTFVSEHSQPEIISLKNLHKIRNVHIISTIDDVSTITFQKSTKRYIGLGTGSGRVALYDTKTKSIGKLFPNTSASSVNFIDFTHDDMCMIVANRNGTVAVYDVKQGDVLKTYVTPNASPPTAMRCHSDEEHLLTLGLQDGTVMQLDMHTGQNKFCQRIHDAIVSDVIPIRNTNLLVTSGYDYKFCIYDVKTDKYVFRCNQGCPLSSADVRFDGRTIAIGSGDGDLYLYDIRRLMSPIAAWKPHKSKINKISFEYKVMKELSGEECAFDLLDRPETMITSQELSDNRFGCNDQKYLMAMPSCTTPSLITESNVLKKGNEGSTKWDECIEEIKSSKCEVAEMIQETADELVENMKVQFDNLHSFIMDELQNIGNRMDQNLNLLKSKLVYTKKKQDGEASSEKC